MERNVYRMIPKAGSINNLKLVSEELEAPGEEEVQVKVRSLGLNFADIPAMFGLYSATPEGSFIPGLEYAGDVTAVGKQVKNIGAGDPVMGFTRFGGYSDHLNVDKHYVVPLPAGWTYEEGAGFLVHAFTAYYGLIVLADIREGQTVLIHSAAGGVGIQANRIAKRFNAYTIGTIGSGSKSGILQSEGYDDWIVRSDHFREDLRKALGNRELNIVMECIGGQIFKDGFRLMAPEGRMIVYGSANFITPGHRPNYIKLLWNYLKRPKIDPLRMIEWNKSVMSFNLIHLYNKKERVEQYLNDIHALDIGKPIIGHVYPFRELKQAVEYFQSGKTTGKVVITVS
jgi:NADPH:quinone reductase-like Zn-dependent oxidoreductase